MTDEDFDPPEAGQEGERSEGERKRLFERVLPELVKRVLERAVESGATRLSEGPESLRHFVADLKLPKEVLHYLYAQIDETKSGLYRAVAKEIRDVLEHTQFADEITKVLTKLSFEIKTEIRFIPNDAAPKPRDGGKEKEPGAPEPGEGGLPKPDVQARVTIRDRATDLRHVRRRREGT